MAGKKKRREGERRKAKKRGGQKREVVGSPFITHMGKTFVIMNWHSALDASGILLIRPLTEGENQFYQKRRADSDAEIFGNLFPTEAALWSPKR